MDFHSLGLMKLMSDIFASENLMQIMEIPRAVSARKLRYLKTMMQLDSLMPTIHMI